MKKESDFLAIRRTQSRAYDIIARHMREIQRELGEKPDDEDAHAVIFYSAPVPGTERVIMCVQSTLDAIRTSMLVSAVSIATPSQQN